jgi:hypothetical protein
MCGRVHLFSDSVAQSCKVAPAKRIRATTIERPTRCSVINLKTAKALGITVLPTADLHSAANKQRELTEYWESGV